MKKKVIILILLLVFISVFRYIGLYKCIDNGNIQLLKVMSFCNPLINAEPVTHYIPLFHISEFAPFGRTPLSYACSDFLRRTTNDYEIDTIEILLKNGANPNIGKPIEWCLRHGGARRYEKAKLLIDYGADYNDIMWCLCSTKKDDTEEVKNERFELFLFVLNNSNSRKGYLSDTIIGKCDRESYYLLENSNVDINEESYTTGDSYTPLFCAAQIRNTKMFKKLIDNGANINYVSSSGNTVEDIITSNKYDYGYDEEGNWTILNYDNEKQEMLNILREARENRVVD